MAAPLPDTEEARLEALRHCRILNTDSEAEFDDITRLAAQICGVPIAAVSLIDAERQWFKSILGLDVRETSRDAAFCAHTILQPGLLLVPDAQADARFFDNPLVTGDPHIRFYAGSPLVTSDGHALGSLCVIDRVPRQLTADQQTALHVLARQAANQLEMTRRLAIQQRLMAEQAATEAENQRLAAIIEASADAIISADMDGIFQSWNAGAERLYGYTASEVIGQSQSVLVPPGDTSFHASYIQDVIEHGRVENLEVIRRRKNGDLIPVSLTLSLLCDPSGQPSGISVVGRDISERKQAEQELQESKQFIESITEHSTSIIFVFDLDTMANVYSNRNVGEFLGYSRQQVQEMGDGLLSVIVHPDDLVRVQAHFGQFADKADGEVIEMEYRALHASGEWRWIWNREVIFKRHSNGVPCQIMGTAQDITERRQAQEEMARLAAIVESSRDAILGMTLDGTLVSWNASAERLYGYSEAEMIGQHASILGPPAERGFISAIIQAILSGEGRDNIEAKRRRKDGLWIDVSLTFSPIRNIVGEIIGIGVIVRDITVQKQAEEALRRSEETLRAVMEGAPIVLYATDSEGVVTLSEGAGLERLGLAPGEAVGRSVFEMYRDAPDIAENLRRALDGEVVKYDAQLNDLCYHNEVRPQRNEVGTITGMVGVGHDVTERYLAELAMKDFSVVLEFQKNELEKANAELAALATTDGLTGLRNRRTFDARLREEFERASRYSKPLSLLLLDIDYFKQYNDAFGHLAGDEVLRKIGRILHEATREADITARYGGEEFAVILPETDGAGALQVGERVRSAVAASHWENREITASLGVCALRLGMARPEELVSCADLALYESKAGGRNRVTFGIGASAEAVACKE